MTSSKSRPDDLQHQHIWLAVAAIIICSQIQLANMTRKAPKQPKAQWGFDEIDAMLTYLIMEKSSLAGVTFKDTIYNQAAIEIASKRTHGPPKTGEQCKSKWGMLKTTFQAIRTYHSKSGCHWDDEHGANIDGPAAEAVWKEYVGKKSNSPMKPFKNNGWPFYSKMDQILPEKSAAQGTVAYNPAQSAAPAVEQPVASTSSAPHDADMSMMDIESMRPPPFIPNLFPINTSMAQQPPFIPDLTPMKPSMAQPNLGWVSQVTKPESEKKPRLSTASGKTRPSTSKKNIQDTANTAVLMNLQGTINRLSDSLNTNFGTDEAHVAEHRSRALKLMQSATGISKDNKVILMHVFVTNAAACDTFLDVDDPELHEAFLESMIARAKQENPTM
ncbi:hypothetical protein DFJ58DRAFT_725099 [Suillus subalutaceus]|uniref:uncharacterized protein n=1 Tax=Suillus subalutaceus TaxID=48586 RepID=UPI001B86D1CA|nr:uncharacterized protein DFJ58DRAFT_725099 [Suillus subalutaceus]KAG1863202.1 hypothetical protein DFJ58DRAFT_725099 [Suillus subalutaceus]